VRDTKREIVVVTGKKIYNVMKQMMRRYNAIRNFETTIL